MSLKLLSVLVVLQTVRGLPIVKHHSSNNRISQQTDPRLLFWWKWDLKKLFQKTTTESPSSRCSAEGGFLVDSECYIYFSEELSWDNAKADCEARGFQLWTPDLDDTSLYTKVVAASPGDLFSSSNGNLWIGIRGDTDVNGVNVSNNHLIRGGRIISGGNDGCGRLLFLFGTFITAYQNCPDLLSYVCEIPI